jgi:hypothetical protein
MLEGTESIVVPVEKNRLRAALEVWDVDVDDLSLADAIEAADTLLQQVGIERQIEQDEVMGKLEIASLRTDLGADQQLAAIFPVGKEGRRAVPLQQAHAFVKEGGLDPGADP